MSAWGIGATAATRRGIGVKRAGADSATVEPPVPSIDTLITWIPGEVMAAYTAIVLALQPEATASGESVPIASTSYIWLIAGGILAFVITWLGGWCKADEFEGAMLVELFVRALFATFAFVIWSFVVPGAYWYSWPQIADNQKIVPILVGLAGVVFALLAEKIVRIVGKK
jgi:hypothetical protein